MELAEGTHIERYRVRQRLGSGGMAAVYLVEHTALGTLHALKVLSVHNRSIYERLLQEGRVQGNLRHPNVVAVTDVVDVGGAPGLVMEYVEGPSLDALLVDGPLPLDEADDLARQIVGAVAAAHRAGVVHRDLKPGNVLLSAPDGRRLVAKVTDFGLAKLVHAEAGGVRRTMSGATLGTPAYMAPEQIRDAANVDHRADVWSLGVVLYELVCGRPPFGDPDVFEIFQAIVHGSFEPLERRVGDLPPRMARAVAAALVVDRDERLASCDALLELWVDGSSTTVSRWSDASLGRARALVVRQDAPSSDVSSFGGRLESTSETFALDPHHSLDGRALPGRASAAPSGRSAATMGGDDDVRLEARQERRARRARWGRIAGIGVALSVVAVAGWLTRPVGAPTEADRALFSQSGPVPAPMGTLPTGSDGRPSAPHVHAWWDAEGRLTRLEQRTRGGGPIPSNAGERTTLDGAGGPTALSLARDEAGRVVRIEEQDAYGEIEAVRLLRWDGAEVEVWRTDRFGQRIPFSDLRVWAQRHAPHEEGWQVTWLDREGRPMASSTGTWGSRLELDDQGRIRALVNLDESGGEGRDHQGVVRTAWSYTDARHAWAATDVRYFGHGSVAVGGLHGCQHVRFRWDADGNLTERGCFDAEGQPAVDLSTGCHRRTQVYEADRRIQRCLGPSGEPQVSSLGWSVLEEQLDAHGYPRLSNVTDGRGHPVDDVDGMHRWAFRWSDRGTRIEAGPAWDARGELVPWGPWKVHHQRLTLDERGREVELVLLDADDAPTVGARGWAIRTTQRDERGLPVRNRFYDAASEPVLREVGVAERRTTFDAAGRVARFEAYDHLGEPYPIIGEAAAVAYVYDERGHVLREAYRDEDGDPARRSSRSDACTWVHRYDARGKRIETRILGPDDQLAADLQGVARYEASYDDRGRMVAQRYFGVDGQPVVSREDGVARWEVRYDALGRVVEWRGWGADGAPTRERCPVVRTVYDEGPQPIRAECLGVGDGPRGFSADQQPDSVGVEVVEWRYDELARPVAVRHLTASGEPMADVRGVAAIEVEYGAADQVTARMVGLDGEALQP